MFLAQQNNQVQQTCQKKEDLLQIKFHFTSNSINPIVSNNASLNKTSYIGNEFELNRTTFLECK